MPRKGEKMTPEQIQARQESRDRNRAAGITKRGKRIKGSIPIFPSKRGRKKRVTKRRWTRANPVKESAAKMAEEMAVIARRETMRKGAALNIIRQVLQLLEE